MSTLHTPYWDGPSHAPERRIIMGHWLAMSLASAAGAAAVAAGSVLAAGMGDWTPEQWGDFFIKFGGFIAGVFALVTTYRLKGRAEANTTNITSLDRKVNDVAMNMPPPPAKASDKTWFPAPPSDPGTPTQ